MSLSEQSHTDNIIYFPFRPRENEPGPSFAARESLHNESKFADEKFGTKKIRRQRAKRQEFLDGIEQRQFERAFQRMEEGSESMKDLKYVLKRAPQFLKQLSSEEFADRLSRIREGRYSNGDVVMVSNHYFLEGNFEGAKVIRRFFYEEKQPQTVISSSNSSIPDIIDIAKAEQNY